MAKWTPPQLGKDVPAKAAKWLTGALLLLLAWTLGRLIWIWVMPPAELILSAPAAQVSIGHTSPAYQIDQIANRHFFGRFNKNASLAKEKTESIIDAPRTSLNLILVGLVASSEPERGLAVIANRGEQKTYGVGESIEGTRVILRQVLNDRVILRNNGRDEALMLAGIGDNEQNKPVRSTTNSRMQSSKNVGQSDLGNIKQEILNNPEVLLKYITLSPERGENGLLGYRIGPGNDGRFFFDAGLKEGDVAVSLNGTDLTNTEEMTRMWPSLFDASEISLTVRRGGQLHEIYIGL